MKIYILSIIVVCLSVGYILTTQNSSNVKASENSQVTMEELSQSDFVMSTYLEQTLYYPAGEYENAQNAINEASEYVKHLESIFSATIDTSDVNMLCTEPVEISKETVYVIEKALYYSEKTNGAFDITVRPIAQLWDITSGDEYVPNSDLVKDRLSCVDYTKIQLDKKNNIMYTTLEGQSIDLGAIAKGYATDKILEIYLKYGITSAKIDLGGNLTLLGYKPDGSDFNVGIVDPRDENNYVCSIKLNNTSVVTSGDYERFFEKDGVRYHHIFDTKTGYPVDNELMGVTIISKNATDADAYSTSVFSMGLKEGMDFVERDDEVECIIINKDKEVFLSSGLVDKVLINVNNDYVITTLDK